jgi:hypothetical protein
MKANVKCAFLIAVLALATAIPSRIGAAPNPEVKFGVDRLCVIDCGDGSGPDESRRFCLSLSALQSGRPSARTECAATRDRNGERAEPPQRLCGTLLISMRRPTVSVVVILFVGSAGAQVHHWTETPKETIWRSRFTNCDMGFAVDLPKGVVAHASLPPDPNDGFLISASDPGTTAEVTLEDQPQRILDVYNEYGLAPNFETTS